MQVRTLAAALALWLAAIPAFAQQPQTTRVRGTIEKVDGLTLSVKSREGEALTLRLAENVTVTAIVPAQLGDIKPGSYIGVSAVPQTGGMLRALAIHIFPEAMRGTGEGHRPWDLVPQSTMTNATVSETVTQVDGPILTLKHKDGEHRVFVPSDTPIVTYAPGERSELKPGAKVIVFAAARQADGTLSASRINVGRGVEPPM